MSDPIGSVLATAAAGLRSAEQRIATAASRADQPQNAVDIVEAKASFAANAAVLSTADRLSKRLFDIIT